MWKKKKKKKKYEVWILRLNSTNYLNIERGR